MNRQQLDAMWDELRADIAAAIEFAESSPLPEPDQVTVDVYTGSATGAPR